MTGYPIYVVVMRRNGAHNEHAYVQSVHRNHRIAVKSAEHEIEWRAGKYECEILEFRTNTKASVFKDTTNHNEDWLHNYKYNYYYPYRLIVPFVEFKRSMQTEFIHMKIKLKYFLKYRILFKLKWYRDRHKEDSKSWIIWNTETQTESRLQQSEKETFFSIQRLMSLPRILQAFYRFRTAHLLMENISWTQALIKTNAPFEKRDKRSMMEDLSVMIDERKKLWQKAVMKIPNKYWKVALLNRVSMDLMEKLRQQLETDLNEKKKKG